MTNIKVVLECRHQKEIPVFYSSKDSMGEKWVGKTVYCNQCRKFKKVNRLRVRESKND